MWIQIPTRKGAILRTKSGSGVSDVPGGRYTQSDTAGSSTGTVQMPMSVLDVVHIYA